MDKLKRPFSNGAEHEAWIINNCSKCKRLPDLYSFDCEIFNAISLGAVTGGTVSMEIWRRMGGLAAHADGDFPYVWECLEFEPKEQVMKKEKELSKKEQGAALEDANREMFGEDADWLPEDTGAK